MTKRTQTSQPQLIAEMLDALIAAEEIISGLMLEHDEDETDVPSMVGIRAAIAKAKEAPASLADPLANSVRELLNAAELVIARWERGDLAEAVRGLDAAFAKAKKGGAP